MLDKSLRHMIKLKERGWITEYRILDPLRKTPLHRLPTGSIQNGMRSTSPANSVELEDCPRNSRHNNVMHAKPVLRVF